MGLRSHLEASPQALPAHEGRRMKSPTCKRAWILEDVRVTVLGVGPSCCPDTWVGCQG